MIKLKELLNEMSKTTMHKVDNALVQITSDYPSEENKKIAQKVHDKLRNVLDKKTNVYQIVIKYGD